MNQTIQNIIVSNGFDSSCHDYAQYFIKDGWIDLVGFMEFSSWLSGADHIRSEDAGWQEAKDAGFEIKEWETNNDGKQRVEHGYRDGERRDINERFSVQFDGCAGPMYPRDPDVCDDDTINCRCGMRFWMNEGN